MYLQDNNISLVTFLSSKQRNLERYIEESSRTSFKRRTIEWLHERQERSHGIALSSA